MRLKFSERSSEIIFSAVSCHYKKIIGCSVRLVGVTSNCDDDRCWPSASYHRAYSSVSKIYEFFCFFFLFGATINTHLKLPLQIMVAVTNKQFIALQKTLIKRGNCAFFLMIFNFSEIPHFGFCQYQLCADFIHNKKEKQDISLVIASD